MQAQKSSIPLDPTELAGYLADDFVWRTEVFDELLKLGMQNEADSFLWCGSRFVGVRTCTEDITHSEAVMGTCHLRGCPQCARREAARLVAAHVPQIEEIVDRSPHKNYRLREIVLTTRISLDDEDLDLVREKVRHLKSQVAALFNHFCGKGRTPSNAHRWSEPSSQYCTGEGYIYSTEGGENGHRIHFHVLFFGRWIGKYELSAKWKELTAGDGEITWIQHVSKTAYAIRETLKYAAKFSKSFGVQDGKAVALLPSPKFIARLMYIFHGMRRVEARGCFRGLAGDYHEPGSELDEIPCQHCGAPTRLVGPAEWEVIYWPEYRRRAKPRLLEFRSGHNSENRSESSTAPPKTVFGQLLIDQQMMTDYAIRRSNTKQQS